MLCPNLDIEFPPNCLNASLSRFDPCTNIEDVYLPPLVPNAVLLITSRAAVFSTSLKFGSGLLLWRITYSFLFYSWL